MVREGDPADALYVLVSGRARMVKRGDNGDEISLRTLRPSDTFRGGRVRRPRGASRYGPRQRGSGGASPRSVGIDTPPPPPTGSSRVLRPAGPPPSSPAFLPTVHRSCEAPARGARGAPARARAGRGGKGEVLFSEGDPPGPMYIIEDGRCRVHIGIGARRRNVAFLRRGEFCGERSVFKGEPRESSVEAVTPCRLLRLTRESYDRSSTAPRVPERHRGPGRAVRLPAHRPDPDRSVPRAPARRRQRQRGGKRQADRPGPDPDLDHSARG